MKQFLENGSIAVSSHIFDHDLYNDSAKLQNIPYGYQGVHKLTVVGVRKRILGLLPGVSGALSYTSHDYRRGVFERFEPRSEVQRVRTNSF